MLNFLLKNNKNKLKVWKFQSYWISSFAAIKKTCEENWNGGGGKFILFILLFLSVHRNMLVLGQLPPKKIAPKENCFPDNCLPDNCPHPSEKLPPNHKISPKNNSSHSSKFLSKSTRNELRKTKHYDYYNYIIIILPKDTFQGCKLVWKSDLLPYIFYRF